MPLDRGLALSAQASKQETATQVGIGVPPWVTASPQSGP